MSIDRPQLEAQLKLLCQSQSWDEATRVALLGYGPEIMGWAVGVLQETSAAQDICQLFSLALWKGLPGFRWESSLRVWAYTIARRELIRFQQARASRGEQQIDLSELGQLAQVATSLRSRMIREQEGSALVSLRQQLPEEMQTLLILRVDRELSFPEIAQVLEIEEEAARQKFKRAKDKLKEMAKKEGLL